MSKPKFTQGEWVVVDKDESNTGTKANNLVKMIDSKTTKFGSHIYSILGGFDPETQREEIEANAHLISQAPAMYNELIRLRDILTMLDKETHPSIELDAVTYDTDLLLAKCRGE